MQTVCVQGLGFVGAAMAVAVALASDKRGNPLYQVIGIDLDNDIGRERINALNKGQVPFEITDNKLKEALRYVRKRGNFFATSKTLHYSNADIVIIDINLDIDWLNDPPLIRWEPFKENIERLSLLMKPNSLLLIETTVPPGTTEHIVVPIVKHTLEERGLPHDAILIAHSYERVMPGETYLDSIINFWRVYSGYTKEASKKCRQFLETIINIKDYPLIELETPTTSEFAKIMENTYRATTIALMDEWARLAENIGIDLFEVVEAIRVRPTHSNIRTPGFGVGGYCLTKDPLMGQIAAKYIYGLNLMFPMSSLAVKINYHAPMHVINILEQELGSLRDKTILLMGITYRPNVADTRYSPSELFYKELLRKEANIMVHDPLISYWRECNIEVLNQLPSLTGIDVVVLATPHELYKRIDYQEWVPDGIFIVDGFNILEKKTKRDLMKKGCKIFSIGQGNN